MRYRRAEPLFFVFEDGTTFDLAALLRGEVATSPLARLVAVSPVDGRRQPIAAAELELLGRLPATPPGAEAADLEVDPGALADLAARGLLFADDDPDPGAAARRERAARIEAEAWSPVAALFHSELRAPLTTAGEPPAIDYEAIVPGAGERMAERLERFGPPPPAFVRHRGDPAADLELPDPEPPGELWALLDRRRTRRAFDLERPLALADFAVLLRRVWGARGLADLGGGMVAQRRTSPSGGALHPIDVYPLALRVDGVAPGIYHYDGRRHSLEPLRSLDAADAAALGAALVGGQSFGGAAAALFVLVARWPRSFWKYRRVTRTYGVVLMDAGHLGQTFALAAAALGLGAFFTAYLDVPRIERELGLDGWSAGPIAIVGCGACRADGHDLSLEATPHRIER